jgi:hypothetical protein
LLQRHGDGRRRPRHPHPHKGNIQRECLAQAPEALAERRRSNRIVRAFGVVLAVFAGWSLLHDLLK